MEEGEEFARQISLWGTTHQEILMGSSVCLLGSSLTSMEVAKGLMLSGIRDITIVDNTCVTTEDEKFYIFSKGDEILNEYKCKVVRENILRMNQLAKITCLVEDPLNYMNEVNPNGDAYDVIICNLSVKSNLSVEKICRRKCKMVITCYAEGYLGYVHVSVGDHLYVQTCGKRRREESEWGVYTNLSLSLYDELKEYVRRVDYGAIRGRGWRDKIVFLAKCYGDFRAGGGGSGIHCDSSIRLGSGIHRDSGNHCDRPFLTFLAEKLKLKDAPRFPPPDETTCKMLSPRSVTHRIKEALLGKRTEGHPHNHIFIFLVVLKSFIKDRKGLPLLMDLNNEHPDGGGATTCLDKILLNRKVRDGKQIEGLIERKKRKYGFRKTFAMSHFVYFFWNFLFIRRAERSGSSQGDCLREHFLEFAFMYGLGLKPIREGYPSVRGRGGAPLPLCCPHLKQKARGELLLCGRHMNLLHFGERAPNGQIKKELNKRVDLCAPRGERDPHMDGDDNAKELRFLLSCVDTHRNVLLNTVRKVESEFNRFACSVGRYGACAQMVIAGLVTQEGVKMCSLYLEPQSSYFFFTSGRRRGGAG
ncbi:ubiquitin-activating enzyme E1, putative [Plasmodium vivax]|uniref:THIF-type NAD/FAD binding fold domain-containing protein n=6 Tax=Plasmodium vivax TaxID=5855 RepID=A5K8E1_PLAVS|nr:hypothetical protein, conserved [Plasmodium vivax]KMZ79164.1 hypothetical protein PVIIG_01638 [Plasmodium vivax India VII]KMZ85309.1 hypothetical protein PVBG_01995 [Plasmodium vivax Brazil I]KMZ91186.1 hypothetical protein PVMG_00060 [Plasmodium vivax Mauritania I]KMZ98375.1 hypothetical protein PVNG_05717 [Plasmodium vivax North Korean]EDL44555.1 hypothetical protein, conserved [Plasmodium vivax]|eukprot:XP_001614282.1 hypothetical protein [Plasmodium vivax Sal-1]